MCSKPPLGLRSQVGAATPGSSHTFFAKYFLGSLNSRFLVMGRGSDPSSAPQHPVTARARKDFPKSVLRARADYTYLREQPNGGCAHAKVNPMTSISLPRETAAIRTAAHEPLTGRIPTAWTTSRDDESQSATFRALAWSQDDDSVGEYLPYIGEEFTVSEADSRQTVHCAADVTGSVSAPRYSRSVLLGGIVAGFAAAAVGGLLVAFVNADITPPTTSPAVIQPAKNAVVSQLNGESAHQGGPIRPVAPAPTNSAAAPVRTGASAATPAPTAPALPPASQGSSAPQVSAPEVTVPQVATPQIATPQVTTPEVATPEVATPEVAAPQVAAPEVATPEVAAPEVATPEVQLPIVSVPVVTPQLVPPRWVVPTVPGPSPAPGPSSASNPVISLKPDVTNAAANPPALNLLPR